MTSAFTQISENALFGVLIAAAVGFTVVSVADAAAPAASAASSVSSAVAKIAVGISHS